MTNPAILTVLALCLGACSRGAARSADATLSGDTAGTVQSGTTSARQSPGSNAMLFKLRSSAFTEGGSIPTKYTCEGDDTSPPLEWSDAPQGTRSFALIVDDPDAPDPAHPKMTYVHWVAYNIPATVTELAEGAGKENGTGMGAGSGVGLNDWKKAAYGGPCPPIGRHRYFFTLHALDTTLDLTQPTKPDLLKAMRGHIIDKAELMGTYQKVK
jgi:Raf kinase inhibitor-like YbhB/YbcL family protein